MRRDAVPEMEVGPPEPIYRGWLQTAVCCWSGDGVTLPSECVSLSEPV